MTKISLFVSHFMNASPRNFIKYRKTFSSWTSDQSVNKDLKNGKTDSEFVHSEAEETNFTPQATSVYVHWPYCKRRCTYCNFNKYIESNVDHQRMKECFEHETRTLLELSGVQDVSSVFFGGGTPSLALPSTISSVLNTVNSAVGCQGQREVTLEVNPTGFETDKLKCLETAKNLFKGKVSVDLIFGWPGQTLTNWLEELCYILPLCDNHVSLYQLTLERGTQLFKLVEKGLVKTIDEDEKEDMYIQGVDLLSKHGFERYEVSNFAKQDSYGFHNISYWSGHQYIGIGPGAHGRFRPVGKALREARIQTLEPNNWMFEVEKSGHATRLVRSLTPLQQLEELLISGLRTKWGIRQHAWSSISENVALPPEVLLSSIEVKSYVDGGLLIIDSEGIRATEKGINILDSMLPDLLLALQNASNGWT